MAPRKAKPAGEPARLPSRGALGNGLRVVAGAVLASGGSLVVITCNREIKLRPERDGTTTVAGVEAVKFPIGTRVEVRFGPTLTCDQHTLYWARMACRLAHLGTQYLGKFSPWWYDAAQLHELLYASGGAPVGELIARLDGCSGAKAGEIIGRAGLERTICRDVTFPQCVKRWRSRAWLRVRFNPSALVRWGRRRSPCAPTLSAMAL